MHASRVLVTGDTIWKGASSVLPMSLSPDDNDDDGHEYHDGRDSAESRKCREGCWPSRPRPSTGSRSRDGATDTISRSQRESLRQEVAAATRFPAQKREPPRQAMAPWLPLESSFTSWTEDENCVSMRSRYFAPRNSIPYRCSRL